MISSAILGLAKDHGGDCYIGKERGLFLNGQELFRLVPSGLYRQLDAIDGILLLFGLMCFSQLMCLEVMCFDSNRASEAKLIPVWSKIPNALKRLGFRSP